MAYCVNPYCLDPDNSQIIASSLPLDDAKFCQSCYSKLLLKGRYVILNKPLSDRPATHNSNARVFEVKDQQEPDRPTILKVLTGSDEKLVSLFAQEKTMLLSLNHSGIPKGYDTFDAMTGAGQILPCLVMEKIIGQNLLQRRLTRGPIDQTLALAWLKQLADILHYIHDRGFFHRDLKPSNIMERSNGRLVMIDFGTARQVTETFVSSGESRTVIFSRGYTAPEQLNGQADMRSDFYSLGKTILNLMMDLPSQPQELDEPPDSKQTFRDRSQFKLSYAFEKLLFDMVNPNIEMRPQNTIVLLKRIQSVEKEGLWRQRKKYLGMMSIGAAIGATIMTPLLRKIQVEEIKETLFPRNACSSTKDDFISCGEEELLREVDEDRVSPKKKEGIDAFIQGDYLKAQQFFKEAFDETKDPETLIYWNNSRIQTEKHLQNRKVSIAAIVPLSTKKGAKSRGASMLRGIAQAQQRALNDLALGLQIILVDDANNPDRAAKLSIELVKRRSIMAGVGHASSDALIPSIPAYESHNFVFIAPASTSEFIRSNLTKENHILFRNLPSNSINANHIVSLLSSDFKKPKIAIYYNPNSPYSLSLKSEIQSIYRIHGGEVIEDDRRFFRIEDPKFDPKKSLEEAHSKGARHHILIPDGDVTTKSSNNSRNLVKENALQSQPDIIIAGDSLAGMPEYLTPGNTGYAQYAERKMIFSASWDVSLDRNSPLVEFWGSKDQSNKSLIDWRTHTSYNATWILASALTDSGIKTREDLRVKLSQPSFYTIGIGSGEKRDRQLSFQERSGEIANPKIYLSMVMQCEDEYITVPYKNPVCPAKTTAARPKSQTDVTK